MIAAAEGQVRRAQPRRDGRALESVAGRCNVTASAFTARVRGTAMTSGIHIDSPVVTVGPVDENGVGLAQRAVAPPLGRRYRPEIVAERREGNGDFLVFRVVTVHRHVEIRVADLERTARPPPTACACSDPPRSQRQLRSSAPYTADSCGGGGHCLEGCQGTVLQRVSYGKTGLACMQCLPAAANYANLEMVCCLPASISS